MRKRSVSNPLIFLTGTHNFTDNEDNSKNIKKFLYNMPIVDSEILVYSDGLLLNIIKAYCEECYIPFIQVPSGFPLKYSDRLSHAIVIWDGVCRNTHYVMKVIKNYKVPYSLDIIPNISHEYNPYKRSDRETYYKRYR